MAKQRRKHRSSSAPWMGFKPFWFMQLCIIFGKQLQIINYQWFYILLPLIILFLLIALTILGVILIRLFCT